MLYTILLMINKVKILLLGSNCWKTKKIIKSIEQFFEKQNIEAEFQIISSLKEFIKYRTWILPSIIINNEIVERAYRLSNNKILKHIK